MAGSTPDVRVIVDADATQTALADLTLRQMNAAIKKGVSLATTEARQIARGGAPKRTGTLRRAISKTTRSRQGVAFGKVYVRPEGYYGYFVENGTSRMKAEPFMKPAEERVLPSVPEHIEVAIKLAIAKAGL